jgi:hypothetical protein
MEGHENTVDLGKVRRLSDNWAKIDSIDGGTSDSD